MEGEVLRRHIEDLVGLTPDPKIIYPSKTILDIRTTYFTSESLKLPRNLDFFAGAQSKFIFFQPLVDFRRCKNFKLDLSVFPINFDDVKDGGFSWEAILSDKGNHFLDTKNFAKKGKLLRNYSDRAMNEWQRYALNVFYEAERRIKNLYRDGKWIPEHFFEFII